MGNEKSLVKSIFGFSISSWVNIVFGLLYTILSTRLLAPEVYGMVSVFMNSSNVLMYIICCGLDASLIRFFNERPNLETKQTFQTKTLVISTVNLLVVFLISTVFLFEQFNSFMFGRLSWFLTVMLFVSAYAHLLLRFFNISYRMSFDIKRYTIQNILIQSSTKILTLIAAFMNPTYEVVIAFQVIGIVIITTIYSIIQRKELLCLNSLTIKKGYFEGYAPVIKYAVFSAPLYISATLNLLLAQNVIKNVLGKTILGVYSSVAIFGTLFSAISTGFSTFWSAYVYKNYDNSRDKITSMSDYITLIAILAMSGFVLCKDILYLFIGEKYYSGIRFFSIVLMTNVIDLLSQATYYGIDIVKKNHITAITNCVYVCINALGAYLGAVRWGIIGATCCMLVSKLILFSLNTIIAQRYYKSIASVNRFIMGLIMIIVIAILPSFNMNIIKTSMIVLFMLGLSLLIYKEQYSLIFIMVKGKIRNIYKKKEHNL